MVGAMCVMIIGVLKLQIRYADNSVIDGLHSHLPGATMTIMISKLTMFSAKVISFILMNALMKLHITVIPVNILKYNANQVLHFVRHFNNKNIHVSYP